MSSRIEDRTTQLEACLRQLRRVCNHEYRLAKHRWNKRSPVDQALKQYAFILACEQADKLLGEK